MEITTMIISIITLLVTTATLFVAWYIPQKIMVYQIYSGLVASYRSPEMGAAILAIFHFYVTDCGKNVSKICCEYKKKYVEQIEQKWGESIDFSATLHFQRRLVAQFYFDMANLRYNSRFARLSLKHMLNWFTPSEVKLLSIILHMDVAVRNAFLDAGDISDPQIGGGPVIRSLAKLYNEMKKYYG